MNIIEAQKNLTQRELIIFNSELQRRQRNNLTAYMLLVFFGGFGVHKFYQERNLDGLFYLGLGVLGWMLFIVAEAGSSLFVMGCGLILIQAILIITDLFSIPKEMDKRNELIVSELLLQIKNSRDS